MKGIKEVKLSYWAHHLTTIISVTLVLVLMGIIALIWISADTETRRLKEQIEISVIMADSIPDGAATAITDQLKAAPYARDVRLITREEALANWTRDTGEDLQALFGVNPLSEEVTFSLNADYVAPANIEKISRRLAALPGVESVSVPDASMVDMMHDNINRLTLILSIVAVMMMIISFVLINNTVHLTIHSRRFLIHTMQLVGATNGFIRRPVILNNMLAGMISGIAASLILAIPIAGSREVGLPDFTHYVQWLQYAPVAGGLVAAGVLLCGLAAWCSASIYLRKDYDRLFR
ncbi:MAG: permease-like cell division protein FtsX [Muribaculaceae bacterium]|nr:permease-like cell division protein FtsX [Muribaculaceae bacterium]